MSQIQILDFQVANLIAAGEVVDRPASVVKELLENAIDAQATMISVEIKRGGVSMLRVTDNGCGMSAEDLPIAIKRHATSKIHNAGDLDNIMTLGFRGEALAAIASVSSLKILSKRRQDEMGTLLEAEGGSIQDVSPIGCQDGTTVLVEELFRNVPARRKFLKSDVSEANAVLAVVEKLSLSRPDIAIQMIIDGSTKFVTTGDGNLLHAIHAVLGREFAKKLVAVDGATEGVEVRGYIGAPDCVRGNRNYQNFFINGRYVKSRTAMAALEQAYDSYIPSERYPVCVLEIVLHPAFVDVNVHPAKLEVKFSNERVVFDAVYCAVRNALTQKLTRPEFKIGKPTAMTADDMHLYNGFVPIYDKMAQDAPSEEMVRQLKLTDLTDSEFTSEVKQDSNDNLTIQQSVNPVPAPSLIEVASMDPISAVSNSEHVNIRNATNSRQDDLPERQQKIPDSSQIKKDESIEIENLTQPAVDLPIDWNVTSNAIPEKEENVKIQENVVDPNSEVSSSQKVEEATEPIRKRNPIPQYRILGVAYFTYIILELEDRLLLIDQHAAHERILFEQMKENCHKSKTYSQMLLVPLTIPLSSDERATAKDFSSEIQAMGYDFAVDETARTALLFQIPGGLDVEQASELFTTLVSDLNEHNTDVRVAREIAYEKALYQASCKAAIKGGRIYGEAHLKWICDELLSLVDIKYCPHGRPVAYEITKKELDRQFGRT